MAFASGGRVTPHHTIRIDPLTALRMGMRRRQAGTEPAGTGEYNNFYPKEGHFACGACEAPLYSATSKFKDSGWIAFDKCFHTPDGVCNVGVKPDFGACCGGWGGVGLGMVTERRSVGASMDTGESLVGGSAGIEAR